MAEKAGPFTGLDDTTAADRSLGSLGDDDSILSDTFDDVEPGGPPPVPSIVQAPELQAAKESTQECMRGPCEHYWRMIMRMDAQAEIITIQQVQYCTRHVELMNLHNENAYECDCWWPSFLVMVPKSARPFLRPLLRELWDKRLKAQGESFNWRWWMRDVFELTPDEVDDLRMAAVRRRRALEEAGTNGGSNGDVRFEAAPHVEEEEEESEVGPFKGLDDASSNAGPATENVAAAGVFDPPEENDQADETIAAAADEALTDDDNKDGGE